MIFKMNKNLDFKLISYKNSTKEMLMSYKFNNLESWNWFDDLKLQIYGEDSYVPNFLDYLIHWITQKTN